MQPTYDEIAENPLNRPPLGLPTGSVRALLTLLIVTVIVKELARGENIDLLWIETLLIALAHYFTSRRFVGLSPDVLRKLENEGHIPKESNPLFLPRHSIRAIIILAFAGLAVYIYRERAEFRLSELAILLTVASYLLGVMVRGVTTWWYRGRKTRTVLWWEDLKAIVVLLVLLATAIPFLLDRSEIVPQSMRNVTLAIVLFYFGSR